MARSFADPASEHSGLSRNLSLYVAYSATRSLVFWLPVFFMFFSATVTVDEVLLLEAIYYAAVVGLEVPSGYFSDAMGRRTTLLIATVSWTSACCVFGLADGFGWLVGGQLLLAVGMAFNSGTDTAVAYESLLALGREHDYGELEAKASAWGFGAMAVSSVVGGALAGWDLRSAYWLSAASAAVGTGLVMALRECPRPDGVEPPWAQLRVVMGQLSHPPLGWAFALAVGLTVLHHVPYELMQPWLERLIEGYGSGNTSLSLAPVLSGGVTAVSLFVSAVVSRRAMSVVKRCGVRRALVFALIGHAMVIAALAVVSPWIGALLFGRGVAIALAKPVLGQLVQPRLATSLRATYGSVESLAGRLMFSLVLLGGAWILGDLVMLDAATLAGVAGTMSGVTLAFALVLWRLAPASLEATAHDRAREP